MVSKAIELLIYFALQVQNHMKISIKTDAPLNLLSFLESSKN